MDRVLGAYALALALLAGAWTPTSATAVAPAGEERSAVVEVRTIGHSVEGRPIRAWRLGEPGRRRIVLISTMHGNEPHTRRILESLRDGRAIRGVDLWVVPTYNPDGLVRGTRRNARGVDLNRNFPHRWTDLDGSYESGPRPASELETRAVMRFLEEVDPRRVLGFHQPLHGIDTDTKEPGFARRLARALRLPRVRLDCGGLCHGTMTMWFNHRFAGSAFTIEYGARPSRHRMTVQAPRQLLEALGAHRTRGG
jgi:murein peptide amidase A